MAWLSFAQATVPLTGVSQIWSEGKGSLSNHSCAITTGGGVKCWGEYWDGELGDGSLTSDVTAIALGGYHSCALINSGVKCWGQNIYNQLGDGSAFGNYTPVPASNSPLEVIGLTSGVTAIALGESHSCAIVNGGAKCWGDNSNGQLGNGSMTTPSIPVVVRGLTSGVTTISLGYWHSCALVNSGVKCWGYNGDGELGNGNTTMKLIPVAVRGLTSGVTAIALGAWHSCALVNGVVKCWGTNGSGELGDGSTTQRLIPVAVSGLSGVTAIALGGSHSCALVNGGVKCWGYNGYGQLGDGSTTSSNIPVMVNGLTSGVTAIALGSYHSCALVNGGVKCWGHNGYGQLSDSSWTDRYTPVDVLTLSSEIDVYGDSVSIADSDITPATTDDTNFGSVTVGNNVSKTYTIANTGEVNLTLSGTPIVALSGAGCTSFSVIAQPVMSSVLSTTGTTTFTVQYAPTVAGTLTCAVSIANDDNDENPYDFMISGTGVLVSQTITFNPTLPVTFGVTPITLTAMGGGATNPVTFTSSPASVCITGGNNGEMLTVAGAGTCTMTADQLGNTNYNAATPVTQTLAIAKKTLTATANDVSRVYGVANPTFNFTYSGGWVGSDTATVLDTLPTATSTATTTSNAGTYPITCTNGSDNNYALTCVDGTLTVTPATQTISYTGPTTATYGDSAIALVALGGGSGNAIIFTSSTTSVCTTSGINGSTLTLVNTGTCTVTANQAGNANYNAATTVTQNITINAKPVAPPSVTTPPVVTTTVTPPPVTSTTVTPPMPDPLSLFLQIDGTGQGKVTTDTGLSCHSTDCQTNEVGELKCNSPACSQQEKTGSYVTLTPQADPDSIFSSWGGHEDCTDGQVFMNSNKLCIAYFHRIYDLTVTLQGSGQVMGYGADQQPMGLDCGNQCEAAYDSGTTVYLQATPGEGMIFSGWSGDCEGTQNPLPVTVTNDLTCQAHFLSAVVPSIPAEASTPEVSTPVVPSIPAEASTPEVSTPEVSTPVVPSIPAEASTPAAEASTPVVPSIPAEASTPAAEASTPVVPLIPAEASTPAAEASTSVVPVETVNPSGVETPTPVTPTLVPVIPIQPPILGGASFSCETTGTINQVCNYGGRPVTKLDIQSQGMVSNGVLSNHLVNLGWVSNFHITANAKLTGGVVTGYIKNDGIMLDFDFKGISIIGGTLGGMIHNTSKVGGYFQDVTLLAGTKIIGGTLKGTIKGDKESPAVLEKVRVKKGSKWSGVILGKGVVVE